MNAFESQGDNGGTVLNIDLIGYDNSDFLTRRETFGSVDLMRDMHRLDEYMTELKGSIGEGPNHSNF